MVLSEYGGRFNVDSNAVSFFTVFQDVGILGFTLTVLYILLLYKLIDRNTNIKAAFLSLLIAYIPQMSWGHHIILAGLALLARLGKN